MKLSDMRLFKKATTFKYVVFYGVVGICLVWIIGPFAWMFVTSLKPEPEIMDIVIRWIPKTITIENYLWVLGVKGLKALRLTGSVGLLPYYRNIILATLGTCAVVGISSTLGAYSLVRFRFPGRRSIGTFLLATSFFPMILMLIPLYVLMGKLRLLDTIQGLILIFSAYATPFSTWIMRGFIMSIPADLEEVAMSDGCGRLGAFFRVTLPLLIPGLVAMILYIFVITWNAFLIPLVLTNSIRSKPISVALSDLILFYGKTNYGGLMAASVITALPTVIIFIIIQKHLIAGMSMGAVKG